MCIQTNLSWTSQQIQLFGLLCRTRIWRRANLSSTWHPVEVCGRRTCQWVVTFRSDRLSIPGSRRRNDRGARSGNANKNIKLLDFRRPSATHDWNLRGILRRNGTWEPPSTLQERLCARSIVFPLCSCPDSWGSTKCHFPSLFFLRKRLTSFKKLHSHEKLLAYL